METNFWQINFWGILGSVTGLLGLVISWLGYRHNYPKLKFGTVYLVTNTFAVKSFREAEFKDGEFFKIYSYFHVFNTNAGTGSFERPIIRMYKGDEVILRLFPDYNGHEDRILNIAGGQGRKVIQTYTFKFEQYRDDELFKKMFEGKEDKFIYYEMTFVDNRGRKYIKANLVDHEPNKEASDFFSAPAHLIHYY